jgi:hypothetical protein
MHEKEGKVIAHHRDAVFVQFSAFTWVHRRSLSVIPLGGIRLDQPIVLMKNIRATGAIEVIPV